MYTVVAMQLQSVKQDDANVDLMLVISIVFRLAAVVLLHVAIH